MNELSISDLIQIYAVSKQSMTHFMMQIYKSDENFFKYGEIFLPMVTMSKKRRNQGPVLDFRALEAFETLYHNKTGQTLQHKKGMDPTKVADQIPDENRIKKR